LSAHPTPREERTLLREVSGAYVHARERYERHQAQGNAELADAAFSKMQEIEASVSIRELNSSWRNEPPLKTRGSS